MSIKCDECYRVDEPNVVEKHGAVVKQCPHCGEELFIEGVDVRDDDFHEDERTLEAKMRQAGL